MVKGGFTIMKKLIFFQLILIILFTAACTNQATEKNAKKAIKTNQPAEKADIIIQDEMVIASKQIGNLDYVEIVMKTGTYTYDHYEHKADYNGEFYIQHYKEGELINEKEIEALNDTDVSFSDKFKLYVNDYNNDRCDDFLLGQCMSTNGTYYRMYTIVEDGSIKQLNVGTKDNLLYINNSQASCELEKDKNDIWKYNQYDQEKGITTIIKIKWNKDKFEEIDRAILD